MEKRIATNILGLLFSMGRLIEATAAELREANAPQDLFMMLGRASAEFYDLSWIIYDKYPQLYPYPEARRAAARMRRRSGKSRAKKKLRNR